MVRPSVVLSLLSQYGVAAVVAVVVSSAPAMAVPVVSVDAATVASCHSTETRLPTQSELETLQALLLKYKVAVPDAASDKTALTRCQFASRLSALLDQVDAGLSAGEGELVTKADLSTFQQLQEAYATELADYRSGRTVENRTVTLEKQQFSATPKLGGEWILPPQLNAPPLPPVLPMPPSASAPVAPTDVQALDPLTERYGCSVGYPVKTFRGKRVTTRHEFAAALNACVDRVAELATAGVVVSQAALSTLHHLETAYAGELAALRSRIAQLEERERRLEQQQHSTTTRLCSEGCGAIVDLTGETLRALRAWLDDPTSQAMTMQFSTPTTLSRESLLQLQPIPLRFQRDALLTSTKPPASRTFTPTTTLHVETVLELSGNR